MSEFTHLKQILSAKIRPLIVWVVIWSLLLFLFANVFNSFSKDAAENAKIFEHLPKGVFNAINIDPALYLTRIEKFISGQFLFVYLLAGSIFSFSLGVNAIGKKIEDRTIATLVTKPIARGKIYLAQFLGSALFLAAAGTLLCLISLGIMNTVLKYQDDVSTSYFMWLFVGSTLVFTTFAVLGQLIGTLLNGGHALQVGSGIIVVSWFISSLGEFAHIPAAVQYVSVFHYFNIPLLRDSFTLDKSLTATLLIIILALFTGGWVYFRKKDIYI